MYMDEQDRKLQERMKAEGKIKIPKGDFLEFIKKYFLEHYNLNGEFNFITVSYRFFDEQHQVFDLNEGKWINRPEERSVAKDFPSFITKEGYEELERLGIYRPGIPERMNISIPGLIEQEDVDEEIRKIINNDGVVVITTDMMEDVLRENGYTDIFYDHYFYSIMDMPSYNIYAKPLERESIIARIVDAEKQEELEKAYKEGKMTKTGELTMKQIISTVINNQTTKEQVSRIDTIIEGDENSLQIEEDERDEL